LFYKPTKSGKIFFFAVDKRGEHLFVFESMIKPTLVYLSLRRLILAMTFANESFFSVNVEYSAHFD